MPQISCSRHGDFFNVDGLRAKQEDGSPLVDQRLRNAELRMGAVTGDTCEIAKNKKIVLVT